MALAAFEQGGLFPLRDRMSVLFSCADRSVVTHPRNTTEHVTGLINRNLYTVKQNKIISSEEDRPKKKKKKKHSVHHEHLYVIITLDSFLNY